MLLMNQSGRIYDVPDEITEKYVATGWNASREAIGNFLSVTNDSASMIDESECGCCCVYSNYCPNK